MKKLFALIAGILFLFGCSPSTTSNQYSVGNVIVSWNTLTNPSPILVTTGVVLVGLGAPSSPGNPQTIPLPSPLVGQSWLVSDSGYSDNGYIYQWDGSTWVQQSRAFDETAVLGGVGYMYTETGLTGWTTPAYYPVYYTIMQTPGDYGEATAVQGETGVTSAIFDLDAGTYSFVVNAYTADRGIIGSALFATANGAPSPVTVSVGQTSYVTANLP